jgi:hypothetical protein
MHRVILLKLRRILRLAQQHNHAARAPKQRVATPLIRLPCRDKVREPLLEELLVDLDLCHFGVANGAFRNDGMLMAGIEMVSKQRCVAREVVVGERKGEIQEVKIELLLRARHRDRDALSDLTCKVA